MRVSQLFNTLLFTQHQQEEEQEVRVSQLLNTLLFTQQEEEQGVRVSQLFNTLLIITYPHTSAPGSFCLTRSK